MEALQFATDLLFFSPSGRYLICLKFPIFPITTRKLTWTVLYTQQLIITVWKIGHECSMRPSIHYNIYQLFLPDRQCCFACSFSACCLLLKTLHSHMECLDCWRLTNYILSSDWAVNNFLQMQLYWYIMNQWISWGMCFNGFVFSWGLKLV